MSSLTAVEDGAHRDALRFAALAETYGWSRASFDRFCREKGIVREEALSRWPARERSLAWSFNEAADATMQSLWRGKKPSLKQLMLARFDQNLPHKRAVAALARSDAQHPFNTLRRTSQTARRMLDLSGCKGGPLIRWLLIFAYSATVLAWLADGTSDQRRTRAAVRVAAFVLGER